MTPPCHRPVADRPTFRQCLVVALLIATAVLVTWTVGLDHGLHDPAARRTWLGYNVLLTATVATCAWLAHRRDPRLPLMLAAAAALVLADAWFDTTTASNAYRSLSVLTAAAVEIPFAVFCLGSAVHVLGAGRSRPSTTGPSTADLGARRASRGTTGSAPVRGRSGW